MCKHFQTFFNFFPVHRQFHQIHCSKKFPSWFDLRHLYDTLLSSGAVCSKMPTIFIQQVIFIFLTLFFRIVNNGGGSYGFPLIITASVHDFTNLNFVKLTLLLQVIPLQYYINYYNNLHLFKF